jgi:hypothetical protein
MKPQGIEQAYNVIWGQTGESENDYCRDQQLVSATLVTNSMVRVNLTCNGC